MSINEEEINENTLNFAEVTGTILEVNGFSDAAMGTPRLGIGFQVNGFVDSAFSLVGLFFWNEDTPCEYEEIHTGNPDTRWDSIRDDGDNNRHLEKRLRCIQGVEVIHHCLDEDI